MNWQFFPFRWSILLPLNLNGMFKCAVLPLFFFFIFFLQLLMLGGVPTLQYTYSDFTKSDTDHLNCFFFVPKKFEHWTTACKNQFKWRISLPCRFMFIFRNICSSIVLLQSSLSGLALIVGRSSPSFEYNLMAFCIATANGLRNSNGKIISLSRRSCDRIESPRGFEKAAQPQRVQFHPKMWTYN